MSIATLLRRLRRRPTGADSSAPVPAVPADLGAIRSLDRASVPLRHPVSGAPLGAKILLASPDHPAQRQAKMDIARAQRELGLPDGDQASIDRIDAAALDLLSAIVLGWEGIRVDGADLAWSPAAVRELLAPEAMRWLRNQLLDESSRLENFIETSAIA